MSNVRRKGPGLEAVLRRLKRQSVTVGVHRSAGAHKESGTTVAEIGAFNEFGTDTIPERSFLRSTMDEEKKKYINIMGKVARNAANGKEPVERGMGKLGRQAQQDVQAKIVAIRTPPNAESTKAQKKGADNPLIDTGQLLQSIRWAFEGNEPQ